MIQNKTEQLPLSHYYIYGKAKFNNQKELCNFFKMGGNTFRRKVKRGEILKVIINQELVSIGHEKETRK